MVGGMVFMRAPFTAALVVLVLIWTVFLIRHNQSTPPQTVHKIESDKIKPPASAVPSIPPAPIVKTEVVVPASIDTDSKTPSKESGTAAKAPGNAGAASVDSAVVKVTGDRPLVLYAYSQTDAAQANLEFFIKHALNKRADFKFIINGDDAKAREIIPKEDNIQIITRPNDCYDLGAYAEVLTKDDLWKKYKKFITINASLRGPFMPAWAQGCWMDMYLGKITDEVKLVGMTGNCWPSWHVQSMIWATDSLGMSALLYPPTNEKLLPLKEDGTPEVGINGCFHSWDEAVHAEIFATKVVYAAGYKAEVMMSAYYSDPEYEKNCDSGGNGDVLWNGRYFGTNVHPFETIFMKTNRDIDSVLMDRLTSWANGSNYSSYEHCPV